MRIRCVLGRGPLALPALAMDALPLAPRTSDRTALNSSRSPPIPEHPPSPCRLPMFGMGCSSVPTARDPPGTAPGPGELLQGGSSMEQALTPQLPAFLQGIFFPLNNHYELFLFLLPHCLCFVLVPCPLKQHETHCIICLPSPRLSFKHHQVFL